MKIDLLFTDALLYNVYLTQFLPGVLAVKDGRIVYAGRELPDAFEQQKTISIPGKYIIPGLIDSHMHIQSSMMVPQTFSDAVLPHGVTTVISEPHEIANVFGLEGIKESMKAAKDCLLDIFLAMPSSVPSTRPSMETTGGEIGIPEIKEMMTWPETICLGEVMNVHDVIYEEHSKINQLVAYVKEHRPQWPIEGHCPRVVDLELATFLSKGITSDHTEQQPQSMRQRLLNGMFIQLQKKSLSRDILDMINRNHLEDRMAFVTDDTMANTLLHKGHLDEILRFAIAMGYPADKAIYNATYTPACRMRLFDRGALDPGKLADFIILDDVETFKIKAVYKKGKLVSGAKSPRYSYPSHFYNSVHITPVCSTDFEIYVPKDKGTILCQAAKIQSHSTMTLSEQIEIPVIHGQLDWSHSPYGLACVIERHGKDHSKGYLFLDGPIMKQGAIATTYAHDHHNLLVLGQNPEDMAVAANEVISHQGGICVVAQGKIQAFVPLPVAGILSEEPIDVLGNQVQNLVTALQKLGYTHDNPIMSITTLGLPVSPAIKLTNKGIVDVKEQKLIPLITQ